MPLSQEQFDEIQELQRPLAAWFSIEDIVQRDRELMASHFIHRASGKEVAFSHAAQDVSRKLDDWAARLLEQEVRLYEMRIAEKYIQELVAPTTENDAAVVDVVTQYINGTEQTIKEEIAAFTQHQEEEWERSWSKLTKMAKRLRSELSITLRLNSELTRLELTDSGYEPLDRIGFAQTKVERFYAHYRQIPHPFDTKSSLHIPADELNRAIRLLVYVIFHPVDEPRLSGYENKFVSAFSRYLTCPRDASSSAVEQVAALFEPFLKKLAFLFDLRGTNGKLIWGAGLNDLLPAMQLTAADQKKDDTAYWHAQAVEDAVFRLAYQLRQKGAHEAHDYPYYERERNAYFVFAALLVSCLITLKTKPKVLDSITHQAHVDIVRDLLVKIEELVEAPYGPRIDDKSAAKPTRLGKLLTFAERAQALWPTCSTPLAEGLESEYLSVKGEQADEDREADIESYLEDMRGSQH
jgi:hypothetical protein